MGSAYTAVIGMLEFIGVTGASVFTGVTGVSAITDIGATDPSPFMDTEATGIMDTAATVGVGLPCIVIAAAVAAGGDSSQLT